MPLLCSDCLRTETCSMAVRNRPLRARGESPAKPSRQRKREFGEPARHRGSGPHQHSDRLSDSEPRLDNRSQGDRVKGVRTENRALPRRRRRRRLTPWSHPPGGLPILFEPPPAPALVRRVEDEGGRNWTDRVDDRTRHQQDRAGVCRIASIRLGATGGESSEPAGGTSPQLPVGTPHSGGVLIAKQLRARVPAHHWPVFPEVRAGTTHARCRCGRHWVLPCRRLGHGTITFAPPS